MLMKFLHERSRQSPEANEMMLMIRGQDLNAGTVGDAAPYQALFFSMICTESAQIRRNGSKIQSGC